MFKIKTKFRIIISLYMAVPIAVVLGFTKDSPIFWDPAFQQALGICLAICLLLILCFPWLPGVNWMILTQLNQIARACRGIKKRQYTYFTLPNGPGEACDENEVRALMRDMNWMIRQIEFREAELEDRVARRTKALEDSNQALVKARDAADASARAKSDFLTVMSHEIRTPLNAVMGMSSLAVTSNRDPALDDTLNIIHTSSRSLLGTINDILDFSKMDAGKLALEKIPLALRGLLEEIADLFKTQLDEGGVEFILDIDGRIPVSLQGDPFGCARC